MMYVLLFFVVVAVIAGSKSVLIVPAQMRYVILRLGRFLRIADPGMTFIVPLLDMVGAKFSMNEQEILVDNTIIRYRVLEPRKAFEGAGGDLDRVLTQAARTAMKSADLVEGMNRLVHHLGLHVTGTLSRFK
jgi:regulator of protease activity HflC (stomatin/prohibitin superfamily)